jgi:hypothetical protein
MGVELVLLILVVVVVVTGLPGIYSCDIWHRGRLTPRRS